MIEICHPVSFLLLGRCQSNAQPGNCEMKLSRYYFNASPGICKCEKFTYSGCGGTGIDLEHCAAVREDAHLNVTYINLL